jgi:hypothetical protein
MSNESVVSLEEPSSVAVTVTVWSVAKALVAAKNTPVVEPGGIVSNAGTMKLVEFEFRPTFPPPDPLRVTVHAAVESGPIVAGLQLISAIPELLGTVTSESVVALEEPFNVPVTVTA